MFEDLAPERPHIQEIKELVDELTEVRIQVARLTSDQDEVLADAADGLQELIDYIVYLEHTNVTLQRKLGICRDVIEEICGTTAHKRKAG